jgi:L-lactate dehydrogenase complex protein LldG
MTARERMLARIRERQRKPPHADDRELDGVRSYVAAHTPGPYPHDGIAPLTRFRERALSLASTLDHVADRAEVPARVAVYLAERSLALRAVCWRELAELDWAASGIEVEARGARSDDLVGITGAYCAVSETGTLVVLSGPDTPPTVSLLPETHIAIVSAERILRHMEDVWQLLRSELGGLPRAVNFISGPSRTADIEQTVTLGAHGPYRVHVIVVGESGFS